jgi:hypothetical protein
MAAAHTEPAPIHGVTVLGNFLPKRNNNRKPVRGKAGIRAIRLFISSEFKVLSSKSGVYYSVDFLTIGGLY